MVIKNFVDLVEKAKVKGPKTIAVAAAQDVEVLLAVNKAYELGLANVILVGNEPKIRQLAKEHSISLEHVRVIDEQDNVEACRQAVQLVSTGQAQLLMKGLVDTAIILKTVLDKDIGLRTSHVLSHVAVAESQGYDRLFFITDAAMNIQPSVAEKKQIIENCLQVTRAMGLAKPNVACVCAVEKVNPKMTATLDAEALVKMNQDGQLTGCTVAGPLALDNAISIEAAKHKGIENPVAGKADILLMPYIEVGNVLYKSLVFFARAQLAGIVVGAKAPVVLTSRADSDIAKLHSIAIGVLMAD